ncbi:MAG: 4'-phosphopantetheinyl transferase superfamily protein [Balneolaceae bacterium]
MELLNSKTIAGFPESTLLGYTPIIEGLTPDILTDNEYQQWDGFTSQLRKNEFLTARHLFHYLLAQGELNPDYVLKKEPLGKPYAQLDANILHVSFSHSKDYAMCAISPKHTIGLDIEWCRRQVNEKLVRRILNENEWKVFGEEDPVKLWTMKEAAVKSLGTGLRTNLNELVLRKESENEFLITFNNEKTFQICNFQLLDHQISIAY